MIQQEMQKIARRIAGRFPYHVLKAMLPLMDFFPPVCSGEFNLKLCRLVNDYRFHFGKEF